MSKLDKIVDDLSALTVLEAAELSKLLEEKWGVSAAAPVAVAAARWRRRPPLRLKSLKEQTEFHRHADGRRRQEDQRDQRKSVRSVRTSA